MYDYREEVKKDIIERIREDYDKTEYLERIENDRDTFAEELNESFWIDDGVTGNASGSYTFNTYKAEENLCHNMDLLEECAEEFGGDIGEWVKKGAEYCDVSIRCYLLGECIESALDELENEGEED
jgi:hypothetical protein